MANRILSYIGGTALAMASVVSLCNAYGCNTSEPRINPPNYKEPEKSQNRATSPGNNDPTERCGEVIKEVLEKMWDFKVTF